MAALVFPGAHSDDRASSTNRKKLQREDKLRGTIANHNFGDSARLGDGRRLSANAQSLDDLYAKAKGEGALVFYVGGPTAPWEAMAKKFNERYPGINVSISGGFSNVLDKKDRCANRGRQARSRCGDFADHRRLCALESRGPLIGVQARRL